MLSFRALLIVASVLCFALRSFGQTVVVISDNPTTGTAVGCDSRYVKSLTTDNPVGSEPCDE